MMKFTAEESVFLEQLFTIRKQLEALEIEKDTHTDRLLSIMRGHGTKEAYSHDHRFEVMRYIANGKEGLLILAKPS